MVFAKPCKDCPFVLDLAVGASSVDLRENNDAENYKNHAETFAELYVEVCDHSLALEKRCSELSLRPPIGAPIWRRFKYLFTGR